MLGLDVSLLTVAGVPPMNGFVSRFAFFFSHIQVTKGNWLGVVIGIEALIEAGFACFLEGAGSVLPSEVSEAVVNAAPAPRSMSRVFVVLMVMCVCSSFVAAAWLG